MEENLNTYLSEVELTEAPSELLIKEFVHSVDFKLPSDYLDFISKSNGAEGPVGQNSYLILLSIEELMNDYKVYQTDLFFPDYFVFGQDAADTAYVIEKKTSHIHAIGFLANSETDPPEFCGTNFLEFLRYLYNRK